MLLDGPSTLGEKLVAKNILPETAKAVRFHYRAASGKRPVVQMLATISSTFLILPPAKVNH